jgi:transposase
VDLGDQWSQYCILGLEGETLSEGQVQTAQPDVAEFFQALTPAPVVIEVGTHSAWCRKSSQRKGTRCWWPIRG